MKRRELFSSFASVFSTKQEPESIIVRPPYYEDETFFDKECIECSGACMAFCQEKIIVIREDGTPELDFTKGGCTYCDECAIHCPSSVLSLEHKHKIRAKIEIDMLKCMSWNSTMCFSCKDPCLDYAIDFLGMFRPTINQDSCTACGFCVGVCPSGAIVVKGEDNGGRV